MSVLGIGNWVSSKSFHLIHFITKMDKRLSQKLSRIYYSPKGFWKGLSAVKKLAYAASVSNDEAKLWLMKQAILQIYLPAPKHIPRPTFDVEIPNAVHKADIAILS